MTIDRLAGWLPAALCLFVASAFALPLEPDYSLVFYLAVLPPLLAALWRGGFSVAPDTASRLAIALVLWSGASLLWGRDDGHRAWKFAGDTLATLGFLLAMLRVLREGIWRRRLADLLVVAGAVNAVFSIVLRQLVDDGDWRLHGWGVTRHPILGAAVMAVAYLTALWRGLAGDRRRPWYLAAAVPMAGFILLTFSRGPLLAASAATVFLCAAGAWRWRCLLAAGLLFGAWWLLPAGVRQQHAQALTDRGTSNHFMIWDRALAMIGERPLFGHGLAANLDVSIYTFPHDLYLSLLFYGGVVAFLLFVAMLGAIAFRLARARGGAEWFWVAALLINALVAGLTDLGQITKGPGPIWFIVWVPVGLGLTARLGEAKPLPPDPQA